MSFAVRPIGNFTLRGFCVSCTRYFPLICHATLFGNPPIPLSAFVRQVPGLMLLPLLLRLSLPVRVLSSPLGFGCMLLDRLRKRLRNSLNLVLAPVILPLQRLQIGEVILPSKGYRHDMIDLPAIAAAGFAIILAHNGPAPGIYAQGFINPHGACLL